jgi:hypothetical protein
MRRPPQLSRRQMTLPLEGALTCSPPEAIHAEVVRVLADLLLEALGETSDSQTEERRGANESEN